MRVDMDGGRENHRIKMQQNFPKKVHIYHTREIGKNVYFCNKWFILSLHNIQDW